MARLLQLGILAGILAVVAAGPWSIARAVVTAMDTASDPAYAAEVEGRGKELTPAIRPPPRTPRATTTAASASCRGASTEDLTNLEGPTAT